MSRRFASGGNRDGFAISRWQLAAEQPLRGAEGQLRIRSGWIPGSPRVACTASPSKRAAMTRGRVVGVDPGELLQVAGRRE